MGADAVYEPRATVADAENWLALETDFFERADMLDTKVGQDPKDDPADVARVGFDAMTRGDGDVVSG